MLELRRRWGLEDAQQSGASFPPVPTLADIPQNTTPRNATSRKIHRGLNDRDGIAARKTLSGQSEGFDIVSKAFEKSKIYKIGDSAADAAEFQAELITNNYEDDGFRNDNNTNGLDLENRIQSDGDETEIDEKPDISKLHGIGAEFGFHAGRNRKQSTTATTRRNKSFC